MENNVFLQKHPAFFDRRTSNFQQVEEIEVHKSIVKYNSDCCKGAPGAVWGKLNIQQYIILINLGFEPPPRIPVTSRISIFLVGDLPII